MVIKLEVEVGIEDEGGDAPMRGMRGLSLESSQSRRSQSGHERRIS